MTERPWEVLFTATASAHVDTIRDWWATERSAAPELFIDELSAAADRLSRLPSTGAPFDSNAVPELRRVVLPRCRYHLYYTIHPPRREVIVRAVWHASRGQGPDFD